MTPGRIRSWSTAGAAVLLIAMIGGRWSAGARAQDTTPSWSEQTLDLLSRVPVQEQGRIKPLSTWARYQLLRVNHMLSFKLSEDERRGFLPWAMDALFFPETAQRYATFLVADSEVLTSMGLDKKEHRKRDRYTYEELAPGRELLYSQAEEVLRREQEGRAKSSEREPLHRQLVMLREALLEFESVARAVDWARARFSLEGRPSVAALFPGADGSVRFTDVLRQGAALRGALREAVDRADDATASELAGFLREVDTSASGWLGVGLFAPAERSEEQWLSARDLLYSSLSGDAVAAPHMELAQAWQDLAEAVARGRGAETAAEQVLERARALAEARGEYEKIDLELTYYSLDPFSWARYAYLLAFVLVAISWLGGKMLWLRRGAVGLTIAALAMHTLGITIRCILRDRPPVSTLYETILFISGVGALSCLVLEFVNRRRIALAIGPLLGALGLFMAGGYELVDRQDTLPQLQAVLDTNFWLTTHVLCITIGYAAGLLAAAFGHIYVLGKLTEFKRGDDQFYRDLGRMVYGTTAFTLIFAVVGTILGGIWANDSWGRFWGWDPKENGALMICLWSVAMLHARLGGYLRPFGLSMASIALGVIVAFSWWGVNLLQVGLHSYGWIEGVGRTLTIYYLVEAALLAAGGTWWWVQRRRSAA